MKRLICANKALDKYNGSTYFFPPDARNKLDKLIEKFGNTYFWKNDI